MTTGNEKDLEKTRTAGRYFERLIQSRESSLFLVVLAVGLLFSLSAQNFFSAENILNICKQVTLVTMVAAGQTFIITSGGIDLSVGSSLGLSSVIMSWLIYHGCSLFIAIPAGILIGVTFGFFNGLFITRLRLPPFIVTLGMTSVGRGLLLIITRGYSITIDSPLILALGNGRVLGIPIMAMFMPVIVIIAALLLNHTIFGTHVKSTGGNELATRLCGINADRVKIKIYTLAGLFCGIAGVIMTGRLNGGNPNAGLNFDMDTIAAVVIGGTSMQGGSGTIIGTMLGAVLMGMIRNGLVLLNVNMYWTTVTTGAIIIIVCAIDSFTSAKKAQ
ncbi:MAG: ABC transporter permease [Synergistaceae bacterium]|jgi:ribose transport system permease protein|nr:ABC transporter permease [Synergistaceae bacterium]